LRDAAKAGKLVDWQAVPPESKLLIIPRERFKSNAEHHVPLSGDALQVIAQLPRFSGTDYLFTLKGGKPINGMSNAKEQLDALMLRYLKALARMRGEEAAAVKLAPFIIHDTRRVVRSHLAALDVPDLIGEMCLGHGRKGIQRTYDLFRYLPQQREALDKWASRLRGIVTPQPTAPAPDNVIKLRPVG
jgi:hypothetical protein